MNCKILAVINQRSNVGKSAISINLAYGLYLKKKKILLIDLDPQHHSSDVYCSMIPFNKSISLAFENKKLNLRDIILQAKVQETSLDSFHVIPSSIKLATIVEQISATLFREKILKNHINKIISNFDYIILDCPPSLGILSINAIDSATCLIIPISFTRRSLNGIKDLFKTINEIKEGKIFNFFILKNLYEQRNSELNRDIHNKLKLLNENAFTTIIRRNEAINKARIKNLPIQIFNPSSKGAQDFNLLAEEVIHYT